jgi:hypothetical protein
LEKREAFQLSVFETVEAMAMAELGLSDPEPDKDLEVDGFWFPFTTVLEMFEAWKTHGVLPHEGGWLDQSMLWREDLRKMTRLFNHFLHLHKDDKRDGE